MKRRSAALLRSEPFSLSSSSAAFSRKRPSTTNSSFYSSSRCLPKQRSFVIRAMSINSVQLSCCLPTSSRARFYASNASFMQDEVNAIKETVSPKFYERKIKELWSNAQQSIEEQAWAKAEDRVFTVLDNVEQLKSALKDLDQDVSTSLYARDDFVGRANVLLGFAQHNQGKRDYAEEHYSTGIKLLKSSLGPEHQEVAYALINLSEVLALLDQVQEAETKVREALAILGKVLGTEHEVYGGALANLGGYLCAQGKLTEAIQTNEQAVVVMDKTLGADNEFTLSTLSNCVKMYEELGDKDGVQRLKDRYGDRHKEFIEMHKRNENISQTEVDKVAKEWDKEAAKKAFDPEGLYKSTEQHRAQLKAFIRTWTDKTGKPLSDEEYVVLMKELDGYSDKQLEEAAKVSPEKLIAAARALREGERDPDDEQTPIHARLENFEKPFSEIQKQTEEEEAATSETFNYDEAVAEAQKPERGYWRRFRKEGERRKSKWAGNDKRPGFMDDAEIDEFKNAEAHEKAKQLDKEIQKHIPPATAQMLDMMTKEEELTAQRKGGF